MELYPVSGPQSGSVGSCPGRYSSSSSSAKADELKMEKRKKKPRNRKGMRFRCMTSTL